MSPSDRSSRSDTSGPDLFEAAAAWCVLLETGEAGPEERAAFDAWIAERPEHQSAYNDAARLLRRVDRAAAEHGAATRARIEPLVAPVRSRRARGVARRLVVGIPAAAGLMFCIGAALTWRGWTPTETFVTDVGARQEAELDDGSRIVLNTASAVEVRYTANARRIELRRGQAQFDVAHDPGRPFIVSAGGGEVRAVGTRFDVREHSTGVVTVTMIEGEVAVGRARRGVAPPSDGLHVIAGERVEISAAGETGDVRVVDLRSTLGWTAGRLSFSQTPLGDAIAEVNRYAKTQIVVSDPALRLVPISGSFEAGDVETFARSVEVLFEVDARRFGDRIVLTRPTERSE